MTVKATNTSVTKAVESAFALTVPNKTSAAFPHLKPETDAYGTNFAGVAFDPALVDCTPAEGWTVRVAGLPTGLKYDAKTGKITGVSAAKAGAYTVTFTATQGTAKEEATITLNVEALPDWAVGSFDGATDGGDGLVSVTVAANGKVAVKILEGGSTLSLSAASFDTAVAGEFRAAAIGKNGNDVVTNEVRVASIDIDGVDVGNASGDDWTAWQNLWKRADTKGDMPVFKASFDRPVELGEKGDTANAVKLTFKKDGVVSFAGKVGGTTVSGSSQLINDGTGWLVTLYAPPKALFDGWSKTFDVTLTTDENNVVTDVTVASGAEPEPPAWGVGHYVGYGQVEYPPATPGGSSESLWGLVSMDMAEDFSFTGSFAPLSGSPAPFSGKMYRVQVTEDHFGYLADNVAINVNGKDALLHFQFITMGFGKMSAQGEDPEGLDIAFFGILHNVWALDDFSEERPTFASGATKYLDLKDYHDLYSQAGTTYTDGDDLTFVFGADGKVAVTGQIFGVPVNSTATLGVNDKIEEGAKFECRAYFEANGRIYYLMCELPSSGTVTSDGIVVLDLALVNGW